MIKIGITGSVASGKTTFAKMIAKKKYPIFSADRTVVKLYKKNFFIKILAKKFRLNKKKNIKEQIKSLVKKNKTNFKKLEKIIHPFVRKEMKLFLKKKRQIMVLEIPLLIESKLTKYFNVIIFVGATRKKRMQRYVSNGGDKSFFKLLDERQLKPAQKISYADHVVNNINTLNKLKECAKNIITKYE